MKVSRVAALALPIALVCGFAYFAHATRAGKVSATRLAHLSSSISVHAGGRGNPWISLNDGRDLVTSYAGRAELTMALENNSAEPLAMASADFDEDGVPDLICGYRHSNSGVLTLLRGNVDSIYPNGSEARERRAADEFTDAPFLSPARVFALPIKAEFIGAGDFDGDGHFDVVAAARNSSKLYFMAGDGKGGLREPKPVELTGAATAMTVGEVNRRDGLADIVVGTTGARGAKALVFEGPEGALNSTPEEISAPEEITSLALGQLDEGYEMDIAMAAGHELLIVKGRDRKLSLSETRRATVKPADISRRAFPSIIRSLAAGQFGDEGPQGLSVLFADGKVDFAHADDGAITSTAETGTSNTTGLKVADTSGASQLMVARVSSSARDDVIMMDSASRQICIISAGTRTASEGVITSASLESKDKPVAMLPMRLNEDALSDLVVLRSGAVNPAVLMTRAQAVFTVTETTDSGRGSLRQAILDANNNPGADTINFGFRPSQAKVILLQSPLPVVTEAVTIDGTSQAGYAGTPVVAIRRGGLGSTLRVSGGNSTVRGLDMCSLLNGLPKGSPDDPGVRESLADIEIVNVGGNKIEGNTLSQVGIIVRTSANIIGGTTPETGNRFAANEGTFGALLLTGQGATRNQIQGNTLTKTTQTCGLVVSPACGEAVVIRDASDNVVGGTLPGARNIISGSGNFSNIFIDGQSATGNLVQGNFIGVGESGSNAAGSSEGVGVSSARNTTIGGTTPQARNVISGNSAGVDVSSNGQSDIGVLIQGNFIGTDVTGTKPVGNSTGVAIFFAKGTTVGGDIPAARNLISGNRFEGVVIGSAFTGVICAAAFGGLVGGADFEVLGNYLGTDVSGTQPLGNGGDGVLVTGNAFSHEIRDNLIAFNGGSGVNVSGGRPASPPFAEEPPAFSIRILRNSIFSNGRLAIDLGNDGVTPNDLRDPDEGANLKQNFPELTTAAFATDSTISGQAAEAIGSVSVQGSFNSVPRQTYIIEFFSDKSEGSSSPPSGNSCQPQASSFLGSTTVTTDANGDARINVLLPVTTRGGFINATATDAFGNTSEYSGCAQVVAARGPELIKITVTSNIVAVGSGFQKPVAVFILDRDAQGNARELKFSEPAKVKRGARVVQNGSVILPDGKIISLEEALPPGKLVQIRFRNGNGAETVVLFKK